MSSAESGTSMRAAPRRRDAEGTRARASTCWASAARCARRLPGRRVNRDRATGGSAICRPGHLDEATGRAKSSGSLTPRLSPTRPIITNVVMRAASSRSCPSSQFALSGSRCRRRRAVPGGRGGRGRRRGARRPSRPPHRSRPRPQHRGERGRIPGGGRPACWPRLVTSYRPGGSNPEPQSATAGR